MKSKENRQYHFGNVNQFKYLGVMITNKADDGIKIEKDMSE